MAPPRRISHTASGLCHLFIGISCLTTLCAASPRSTELIDSGSQHLQEGRLESALAAFDAASQADPTDGQAAFFQGITLNRLGRSEEALNRLQHAKKLGFDHPDLSFELGWSLLELRRWQEAIDQLKQHLVAHPDRGQTHEFLGRAYLALGHLDQADAAFRDALEHDPDLAPTIAVYRALLEQRRGRERAARDHLAALLNTDPDSPTGQVVRSLLDPIAPASAPLDRSWRLGLRAGVGYNTNARGIELRSQPIPSGGEDPLPEREGSAFARLGLDAGYTLLSTTSHHLELGYQLVADQFAEQQTDADLLDQYIYLEHTLSLNDRAALIFRISDNHTIVGEENYRNQFSAHGAFNWIFSNALSARAGYTYAVDDFLYDLTNEFDNTADNPDASVHTIALSAQFNVPKTRIRLRGGFLHTWNIAHGDDFDYDSNSLFIGASCLLPWKITADLFYVRTFDRYDNPNSATDPQIRRSDDLDGLTLHLRRPLNPHLSIYFEYTYNRDNSNIAGYDYEQHVTSTGLAWEF